MKHKCEKMNSSKLVTYVLLGLIVVLGLVCLYYGSFSAPGLRRSDDDSFDGSDPVLGGFARNKDFDDLFEDQELNPEVPKSIPVCKSILFYFFLKRFFFVYFV